MVLVGEARDQPAPHPTKCLQRDIEHPRSGSQRTAEGAISVDDGGGDGDDSSFSTNGGGRHDIEHPRSGSQLSRTAEGAISVDNGDGDGDEDDSILVLVLNERWREA